MNIKALFSVGSKNNKSNLNNTNYIKNVISGYLSMVWIGLLSLAFIPIYINKLGENQWAVVAVCITVQSILGLLDLGLSQISTKEIAKSSSDELKTCEVYSLFQIVFVAIGISGFILAQISTSWLVTDWFKIEESCKNDAAWAIRLVSVQFLFQFANNINYSYWNGMQRHTVANKRQAIFLTIKHITCIVAISYLSSEAITYAASFSFVSVAEYFYNKFTIMKEIPKRKRLSLNAFLVNIKKTTYKARPVFLMSVSIMLGLLTSQIDRIVLSNMVSAVEFGQYVAVATFGLAFLQLQYPVTKALLPKLAANTLDGFSLQKEYILVILICVVPCMIAAFFSRDILYIWSRNDLLADYGASILSTLLVAVALNAFYNVIYQAILVNNNINYIVYINFFGLSVTTLIVCLSVGHYGSIAGALGWMSNSITQLALSILWLRIRKSG